MQRRIAARSLSVAAAGVLMLLAGCTQGSGDQTSTGDQTSSGQASADSSSSADEVPEPEDLVGYACALVADVNGSAQDWDIGPDADSAQMSALAAATDLLGAPTGTSLKGYDDLFQSAQTMYQGLQRVDAEAIDDALGDIRNSCEEEGLPEEEVDTSEEGRTDFGCSMIGDVEEADTSLDDWAAAIGQETPSENSLRLTEAFGAAGLLGASPGQSGTVGSDATTEGDDLSNAAQELQEGLIRLDTDQVAEALDSLNDLCGQR